MYVHNSYRNVNGVVYTRRKSERIEMYNLESCLKKLWYRLRKGYYATTKDDNIYNKIITFW